MSVSTAVLVLTIVASSYSAVEDTALTRATNYFGINLLKKISSEQPSENVVFSPSGISAEVAMVYAGAAGQCAEEASRVLGHIAVGLLDRDTVLSSYEKLTNNEAAILTMANAVLVRNASRVLESYKSTLRQVFAAEFKSVDFSCGCSKAASEISEWMREKTHGRIEHAIGDGLPMNTVVYVVNTATLPPLPWLCQFEPNSTRLLHFFNHGTKLVQKEVMSLTANIRHVKLFELHAEAVELLYRDSRLSMIIVLPDSMTGLPELRDSLSIQDIDDIDENLRLRRINLRLPKFNINNQHSLVPTLRRLGMGLVFGIESDLSNISPDKDLYVSEVRHVAVMSVSEEGTDFISPIGDWEPYVERAIRSRPFDFYMDHPFLFYVRDRVTNRVLVMGEVREL